jgi:hypothetical protein
MGEAFFGSGIGSFPLLRRCMLDKFQLLTTVIPFIPGGQVCFLFFLLLLEVAGSGPMGLLPRDDSALRPGLVALLI